MAYNKFINWNLFLKTVFTITSAIIIGIGVNEVNIWLITAGCIATLWSGYMVYNINIISTNRINILLEAIQNKDYSFRFKNAKSSGNDKIVFDALNTIIDLLKIEKLNIIQREKYYELILNNLKTAIIVINDSGKIIQTNNEALSLFELHVLTHVSQFKCIEENLDSIFMNLQSGQRQHVSVNIEARELHLFISVAQLEVHGDIVKVFTINDIHSEIDKKELDSWIKLTRVLTHEIMNGIAPISSLSDNLLKDKEAMISPRVINALEVIKDTSHSLLNFVESYRKFTSIPIPNPTLLYVKDALLNISHLAESFLDGTTLSLNIEPDNIILYADNSLISQVILNLIKNATQAFDKSTNNKQIKINAYCDKDESVIIEIANNGPSIPQAEAEQIFVPFFTTKEHGSGIGLSISRQIMLLSGGSLTLRCDYNKEFTTTFILTFN